MDIIKWKLTIGNGIVQKIISEDNTKVWFGKRIGSKILGYYKNPYGNSIVVVTNHYTHTRYPENDTLWGTLNLFGCNLDGCN